MQMRTLGTFVVALFVVVACGGEGGDDTTTVATDDPDVTTTADPGQATTTTEAMEPTTSEAMDTTSSAAEAMDGIHTAESDLGTILVDPDGFTLYIFTVDGEGESACYDDCAATWPPVPADTPISSDLDQSIFGSIERTDDIEQLTVSGMPLYLYAPDSNPGDTTGQGVGDVWFVVDAEGNMIEASASGEEDVAFDYDY